MAIATKHVRSNDRRRGSTSILGGALWMVVISLGLFFLPAINGLIAGFVGGYKVGSVKRALLAALLPAVVIAGLVWVVFVALDLGLLGLFAGFTVGVIIAIADLGLFVGAVLGALVSDRPAPLPEARVRS